ncbi:MAG TPA: DUF2231 domain-containing protein [Candidatus Eisenbacteria bacterium]|jgi:uncharacterized membrane protein
MSLSFLGPLHPLIVHTPIVMLIFSAFFAVVGRLFDRDWLRKTSVLMLVFGFLGAFLAVRSGTIAHRVPEHQQGVPEKAIDEHGGGGVWVMYLSGGALLTLGIASRLAGGAASALSLVALLLQLLAASAVSVTAYRGGKLVYEHGANVKVDGQLVKSANAGKQAPDEDEEGERGREHGRPDR